MESLYIINLTAVHKCIHLFGKVPIVHYEVLLRIFYITYTFQNSESHLKMYLALKIEHLFTPV